MPSPPDWTAIGNLDLVLGTDDLTTKVTIENYVSVRLTLGEGASPPSGSHYEVEVLGARWGEIDASGLDGGLDLLVMTGAAGPTGAGGAGGAGGFLVTGSGFDDRIVHATEAATETDAAGDGGAFALSLAYGYDDMATTAGMIADWEADGAIIAANGHITSHRSVGFRLPEEAIGLGVNGTADRSFEIDGADMLSVTIGGAFAGLKAAKVTIDLSLFYQNELIQQLGSRGYEGAVVTLLDGGREVFSGTFASRSGDQYSVTRPGHSQIVIDGEGAFVFDTVSLSAIDDPSRQDPHDFLVRSITFEGAFAAGGDRVALGPGADVVTYDATDAANHLDILAGFTIGRDRLRIDTGDGTGGGVTVAEIGSDTVFTFAADAAKAIVVEGVSGLVAGEDYVFF